MSQIQPLLMAVAVVNGLIGASAVAIRHAQSDGAIVEQRVVEAPELRAVVLVDQVPAEARAVDEEVPCDGAVLAASSAP